MSSVSINSFNILVRSLSSSTSVAASSSFRFSRTRSCWSRSLSVNSAARTFAATATTTTSIDGSVATSGRRMLVPTKDTKICALSSSSSSWVAKDTSRMYSSSSLSSSIQRLGTDANPNMSSAVVHGGILTTMGVIDMEGKTLEEQTKNILAKIDSLLAEGGTDKSKLLTANIWLKDIATDFKPFNEIWVNWIQADNKPIRACVEANLAFPSLLVEIQVTAAV